MLSVVVTGPRGGKVSPILEDRLLDVSYVCMRELNICRFNGVVYIKIFKDLGGASGFCMVDRVQTKENRNEWEVVIELVYNSEEMVETISTLCHEFVHAKQFLRKELSEYGHRWKGKLMKDDKSDPWGIKLPHEKEAYRREKVIFNRVAKNADLKWVKQYNMVYDRGII